MGDTKKTRGLLGGIRVLDLADEKGGFCSKLLADLGARVIKIEHPSGDSSRKIGPFLNPSGRPRESLSFFYHNSNKLGITLNIEHIEGKSIFLRLVEETDVIVESFYPGYLEKIGLSFDILRDVNPGLILASVTGFGQNGSKSSYRSCDLVASAFGGQMYLSGSPSTSPLKAFGEQSYYTGSLFAAIGVLLSLRKRDRDGAGEHLDISLQESVAATLDHGLVRYFTDRVIPERKGARHWNNAFFIFPCKDGFMQMTVYQQWETLVQWIDSEGMAADLTDKKWEDEAFRNERFDHITKVISRWTRTHTVKELFEQGQLMRFPWAPVQPPEEVLNSPQLKDRGFFIPIRTSKNKVAMISPGMPYRFSAPLNVTRRHTPEIGEDNMEIYQKELGLSDKELRRLHHLKVI
ncbi:CaiB/BaiF CoA transferase family protein [Thermodesulfobacteriota bacterium]